MESEYYHIIHKFYSRYRYRKGSYRTPAIPKKENIQIQKIYVRNTIFSDNENIVKKMLVIHFCNLESDLKETIRLNVCYNDYIIYLSKS